MFANQHPVFFPTPFDALRTFYKHIEDKEFEDAFWCMSDRIREAEPFRNDSQHFAWSYGLTKSVRDVRWQPVWRRPERADYHVIYTHEHKALRHDLIDDIHAAQAENSDFDINSKRNMIDQFKQVLMEWGGNKQDVVTLSDRRFLSSTAVYDMLWLTGLHTNRSLLSEFKKDMVVTQDQRLVICTEEKRGWQISTLDYIRPGETLIYR